jgi:hypothetical protein
MRPWFIPSPFPLCPGPAATNEAMLPTLLANGGPMMWILLGLSGVALVRFSPLSKRLVAQWLDFGTRKSAAVKLTAGAKRNKRSSLTKP